MQDVAAALILSEAVYKAVDSSLKQAVEEVVKISADLPPILHQPLKVQWSLPHVFQRLAPLPPQMTSCPVHPAILQSYSCQIVANLQHDIVYMAGTS